MTVTTDGVAHDMIRSRNNTLHYPLVTIGNIFIKIENNSNAYPYACSFL